MSKLGSVIVGIWGIGTLLGIVFAVLRVTKAIAWEWRWVLSPFFIGTGAAMIALSVAFAVSLYKDR